MRHPHSIAREQHALNQARTVGRRHRQDDRELEDARYTDEYREPYQAKREDCVLLVETDRGWETSGRYSAHGPAVEIARMNARHCIVRDARTRRIIFDNRQNKS